MNEQELEVFGELPTVVTLSKQVEERIRLAITAGKMRPGVLYTEPNLAKQMGVSRTPVREAVLELTSRGLLTIIPRRGFQIRWFTEECIKEVYDLRIALELHAVEVLSQNPGAHDFASLTEAIGAQEKGANEAEIGSVVRYGRDFHHELLALAGNGMVLKIFDDIRDILQVTWAQAFSRSIKPADVVADHKKLVNMIQKGETEKARKFLRQHLERSQAAVLSAQSTE